MSVAVLLAAAAGALVAVGGLVAVLALTPTPAPTVAPERWRTAWRRLHRVGLDPRDGDEITVWVRWRQPLAVGAGLTGWAVSGWPVAGLTLTAAVVGVPLLLAAGRAGQRDLRRGEAIEEWTRRLADVLITGAGLEQAVTATVPVCPTPIRHPVTDLATRLAARWPTETALWAFADDLDDATGDLLVAALVLGSRRRGPGLATTLTTLADTLADQITARRKIEAERARPRTTARTVTALTLTVLAIGAVNTTYLRPYGTGLGQLVLAVLLTAYAATLTWLHALGHPHPGPRLLTKGDGFTKTEAGSARNPSIGGS